MANEIENKVILEAIDTQKCFRDQFNWMLGRNDFSHLGPAETPIFSALLKNEFALYASLKLTNEGLFGSSRVLLRSVFEGLMIAKFASVSGSHSFIEKWKRGDTIYFSKAVLRKIEHPVFVELSTIWSMLCEFSHATVYSQQISIQYDDIEEELRSNYTLIMILASFSYHLLNRHFVTPSMCYYTRRYGSWSDLNKAKIKAKNVISIINSLLNKHSRAATREYSAKWQLKS